MGRFVDALRAPGLGAIAEIKRRSPSAGDLRPDADPARIAPAYARAGAAAVSVLVDARFGGTWDDLRAARAASDAPLLAKGFFSTPEDLRTAKEAGADAVLLLLRDLEDDTARSLTAEADRLGLDTLVEAHDAAELAGADAILVGSALMRAPDPAEKLAELVSRPLVKVCGLTRQDDVDAAAEAGADLLGFIFAERSPRRAAAVLDVPDTALSVAVFVADTVETDADLVQFYPDDGGTVRSREALLLREGREVARVLDQPWQERDPTHWSTAAGASGRIVLAGGLGPDNVRDAIAAVRPWAVDAASSLESEPGVKDHDKVRAYVEAAHA
jgi:phosphoribosylanthranilate isomerase